MVIAAYFVVLGVACLFKNKKVTTFRNKILLSPGIMVFLGVLGAVAVQLMGYPKSFAYDQFIAFAAFMLIAWPIKAIISMKYRSNTNRAVVQEEEKIAIPESVLARRKIVVKFNERFSLKLTDAQIDAIVSGSFQSRMWANEIYEMDQKYNDISEWYAGETGWLRAYMKVFSVQNIATDFDIQKEICVKNFNEVFASIDASACDSVQDWIDKCDAMFLTNFDESGYMIAYKFLEKNGHKYELPNMNIVKVENELSDLMKKYESGKIKVSEKL
ncbi:MAG: hypothetical protein PUA62_05305 [Lachnospiraceae bacterium]|nr:hypothetical protein [Lachnospiraceae bacterium]